MLDLIDRRQLTDQDIFDTTREFAKTDPWLQCKLVAHMTADSSNLLEAAKAVLDWDDCNDDAGWEAALADLQRAVDLATKGRA